MKNLVLPGPLSLDGARMLAPFGLALSLLAAVGCGQKSADPEDAPMPTEVRTAPLTGPQTVVTYQYDKLGRLRSVEYPNATKRVHVDYDNAGNRTRVVIDNTITNPNPTAP